MYSLVKLVSDSAPMRLWLRIKRDHRGQDLIEYALMVSFLSVAVAAIFPRSLSPNVSTIFSKVSALLASAPNGPN